MLFYRLRYATLVDSSRFYSFSSSKTWFFRKSPIRHSSSVKWRPSKRKLRRFFQLKSCCFLVTLIPLINTLQEVECHVVSPPKSVMHNDNSLVFKLKELCIEWASLLWEFPALTIRVVKLGATFLPLLLAYPFVTINEKLKLVWFNAFTKALEISGPIYIKFGQWASTRRDIFPHEFCNKLEKLQKQATTHSWNYTQSELLRVYGSKWCNIFPRIDCQPVGSGAVAQVYKAWLNPDEVLISEEERQTPPWQGRWPFSIWWSSTPNQQPKLIPVALKVLHPGTVQAFKRDLAIMKFSLNLLTTLIPSIKWINLSSCMDEFALVMFAQIDLRVEGENLAQFGCNFANCSQVHFPKPFLNLSRPSILVETFEEGESISNFVRAATLELPSTTLQSKKRNLAKLGAHTLLKMVFIDNFVHGDLHPGNILVQEKPPTNENGKSEFQLELPYDPFSAFSSLDLGDMVYPNKAETKQTEFRLVILDCGIVTLVRREKLWHAFRETFKAIINGEGEKVGDLFLETSQHECRNIYEFRRGMNQIVQTARQQSITLAKVNISSLMQQVFSLLIKHQVRLESEFSAVVLAVMILEGLGRSLDPELDLIEEARPYLLAAGSSV